MMADIQPALSRPITGQSMKRLRQRNSLRSTRGKPCWTVVFASAAVQTRRWNPTTLYTAYRQRRRGQLSTAAPGRLAAYGKAVCGRSFTAVHRDAGLFCIYGRENRQNKKKASRQTLTILDQNPLETAPELIYLISAVKTFCNGRGE